MEIFHRNGSFPNHLLLCSISVCLFMIVEHSCDYIFFPHWKSEVRINDQEEFSFVKQFEDSTFFCYYNIELLCFNCISCKPAQDVAIKIGQKILYFQSTSYKHFEGVPLSFDQNLLCDCWSRDSNPFHYSNNNFPFMNLFINN